MASTYSTNLKIELIGTGDQSGTWGATTNTNLGTLIEQAIAGYTTQAVTDSGVATVLTIPDGTSSTGRNYVIALTGALTANRTVEVPAVNKPYIFFNNTTGGYSVTVKVSGQTGVTIANGKKAIVYTNSTDVIEVANAPVTEAGTQTLTNKTLTNPTINGFTGDTSVINVGSGQLYKDASGNVGIGTSSPTAKLDIGSGNLTFSSTGQRITGDFSNATVANRTIFQSGTTNGSTGIIALPNGTATGVAWRMYNSSSTTNASIGDITIDSSNFQIRSYNVGTGTYLPMTFQTGGSEAMRIGATSGTDLGTVGIGYSTLTGVGTNGLAVLGKVGIGTSSPALTLNVKSPSDYRAALFETASTNGPSVQIKGSRIYELRSTDTGASEGGGLFFIYDKTAEVSRLTVDATGQIGIGTTSPGNKLQITGAGTYQVRITSTALGTEYYDLGRDPTDGYFAINGAQTTFVGYKWNINGAEKMRIDSSGNVGIGTSSPGVKLDVYTPSASISYIYGRNTLSTILYGADASGAGYSYVLSSSAGSAANMYVGTAAAAASIFLTNATERMRIDSSGNVGIGTSSPGQKLDVVNTANSGVNIRINATNSGSSTSGSFILGSDIDSSVFYIQQNSSTNTALGGANSVNFYSKSSPMTFWTQSTRAMTIDSSGNVGIGTSSPSSTFKTTISYSDNAFGGGLYVVNTNTGANAIAAIQVRANNAGVSGVQLYQTVAGDGAIMNFNNSPLIFGTNNAERMRIDSSGNVGIGTSSPGIKLDVIGPTAASGSTSNVIRAQSSAADTATYYNGTKLAIQNTNSTSGTMSYLGFVSANGNDYGSIVGVCTTHTFGAAVGYLTFGTNNGSGATTERMRIDSSGNLLVGTTTAPSGTSIKMVINGPSGNNGGLQLNYNSGTYGGAAFTTNSGAGLVVYTYTGNVGSETYAQRMSIDANGNVIAGGSAALATTATNGFLYVPTCAGTPTGTPTTVTGMAPIVVNTTNNKLYFYSGGAWRDAGP